MQIFKLWICSQAKSVSTGQKFTGISPTDHKLFASISLEIWNDAFLSFDSKKLRFIRIFHEYLMVWYSLRNCKFAISNWKHLARDQFSVNFYLILIGLNGGILTIDICFTMTFANIIDLFCTWCSNILVFETS